MTASKAFWIALLVLVAAAIRIHGAGAYHYNQDEAMITTIASAPNLSGVYHLSTYETHPPLFYMLEHFWLMISEAPAFARGFPLLCGLLLIPLYYRIGARLNGPMTGIACAILIAFSNGCIIQSYVVRQYMPLILFASLAYDFYLQWRAQPRGRSLALYGLFGALACCTHFSGIFFVFCIAAYETLRRLREKTPRLLLQWIATNLAVAGFALLLYFLWQPVLSTSKFFIPESTMGSPGKRVLYALFYPFIASGYILPDYAAGLILLPCLIAVAVKAPSWVGNRPVWRMTLQLLGVAIVLGMAVTLSGAYFAPGTRHGIWVLPFIIPPLGWMIADGCTHLSHSRPRTLPVLTALLITLGYMLYSPHDRFSDGSEYDMPQVQWNRIETFMKTLGPEDLVVAERDDLIFFLNPYGALGEQAFTPSQMSLVVPYNGTHFLINPFYRRYSSRDVMLATLAEAQKKHETEGIRRLVFLHTAWSYTPLEYLFLCPQLDKTLFSAPLRPADHVFTSEEIRVMPALFLLTPTQAFYDRMLTTDGKARVCLAGKHDPITGIATPLSPALKFAP